jgi:hypothetical protein
MPLDFRPGFLAGRRIRFFGGGTPFEIYCFAETRSAISAAHVRYFVLRSPCVNPSVGDPRLAISVSISDVISDSLTNRSDPSSRSNLQPSRCPPAPNSISYARNRFGANGRLMMFQGSIRLVASRSPLRAAAPPTASTTPSRSLPVRGKHFARPTNTCGTAEIGWRWNQCGQNISDYSRESVRPLAARRPRRSGPGSFLDSARQALAAWSNGGFTGSS